MAASIGPAASGRVVPCIHKEYGPGPLEVTRFMTPRRGRRNPFMKKLWLVLVGLMLFARPAFAQDVEAMAKWTGYQIVHYKIVGEYAGETIVMKGTGGSILSSLTARVTDRIEIEFDWDQQEFNVVGKPVIRNFPTKVVSYNLDFVSNDAGKVYKSRCPEPKPSGPFELVTGLAVKADEGMRMSGVVNLEVRRDQPGGSYASFFPASDKRANATDYLGKCGEFTETAKPLSETSTMMLHAVPGMYLVMPPPATGEAGMKLSSDKKSIILPPGKTGSSNEGWTWTVTPTGVK